MTNPAETRLCALDHARALLDQERSRLLQGEAQMLYTLINPRCDDPDCSCCCEQAIEDAGEFERWLDGRYRSAFNKLLFEVSECECDQ
jgi:hypothetical protein